MFTLRIEKKNFILPNNWLFFYAVLHLDQQIKLVLPNTNGRNKHKKGFITERMMIRTMEMVATMIMTVLIKTYMSKSIAKK